MAEAEEKPSDLPPYPELINEAITALDNADGSSKTEISEYIESQHKELPAGHSTLLAHHLNKMKESGVLELINDNYKKAVPVASKKRGRPAKAKVPVPAGTPTSSPRPRGRPPKPKVDVPAGSPLASPKPRGRPPKTKDASATPKPRGRPPMNKDVSATPKPRGRPPKNKDASATPKPRGRPPKNKDASATPKAKVSTGTPGKRGRPPTKKAKTTTGKSAGAASSASQSGVKRGRGRPPKAKA